MDKRDRIVKDALIENNVLSLEELKQYLSQGERAGISLKEYLLQQHIITEKQLLIALSQSLKLGVTSLNHFPIPADVIGRVPVKFTYYYQFMPLKIEQNVLTIASALPIDVQMQDEIKMHLGLDVKVVLALASELNESFKKYYGFASNTIDRMMIKEPLNANVSSSDTGQWVEDLETKSEDPTVAHLVNQIILEAYKKRATDIHMEPYREKVRFRYRIDGILVDAHLPLEVRHFLPSIISRIKILANLTITEKRLPQDGSAVVKTKEQNLDLRVSTIPTPWGESMVIRILPAKVILFSLEKLGFDPRSLEQFRELIEKPHGIIFITGPTGSGKTTTLYACLNEINTSERKIITIEDPVEYEMEGITQVQVNAKVNFNFAAGLRSLLRHDPDIIMVGEVRDLETAETAIRTSLTGHLVFSTLHTNDASSGVTRLIDMGVEPYLAASSVQAFVAQRLVRVICPQCKELSPEPLVSIKEEIQSSLRLQDVDVIQIYHGRGCEYCNNTGYYGRIAIYEILTLNDEIKSAILEKQRAEDIKKIARKRGMVTLRENGWQAVLKGITTPAEVINVSAKDESSADDDAARKNYSKKGSVSLPVSQPFEARKYSRAAVSIVFQYRLVQKDAQDPSFLVCDGEFVPMMTQDLSAGGLRFVSQSILSLGYFLEVNIQLKQGEASINCLTKVIRVEEELLSSMYTTAVVFIDLSKSDRERLDEFVEGYLRESKEQEMRTV